MNSGKPFLIILSNSIQWSIISKALLASRNVIYTLALLNPNNHYNHGFPNTFDYNHYVYSDYLVCSVPAIAHIIHY